MNAEVCVANNVNIYLDQMSGLGTRYLSCKELCYDNNPKVKKQIEDMKLKTKTEYFDPHNTDPCLKECKNTFFFVAKRLNRYLIDDKGFYKEN